MLDGFICKILLTVYFHRFEKLNVIAKNILLLTPMKMSVQLLIKIKCKVAKTLLLKAAHFLICKIQRDTSRLMVEEGHLSL